MAAQVVLALVAFGERRMRRVVRSSLALAARASKGLSASCAEREEAPAYLRRAHDV